MGRGPQPASCCAARLPMHAVSMPACLPGLRGPTLQGPTCLLAWVKAWPGVEDQDDARQPRANNNTRYHTIRMAQTRWNPGQRRPDSPRPVVAHSYKFIAIFYLIRYLYNTGNTNNYIVIIHITGTIKKELIALSSHQSSPRLPACARPALLWPHWLVEPLPA